MLPDTGTPARVVARALLCAVAAAATALAGGPALWGEYPSRNMVSGEKNLPETLDPATGRNIKWSVPLGSRAYSTPVVARGRVLIGTNNRRPRDPRHKGDRGILMCLDEADGKLLWQLVVPKLRVPLADVAGVGLASPATVEGDRVYVLSNRGEVLCLDLAGQHDGNAGPFRDEGRYMAPRGKPPVAVGRNDADIIWRFDMVGEVGTRLHDGAHCSALVHGRFVYCSTCNGVDETHKGLPRPEAPSLVVLDKATGRLVATDDAGIGPQLIHCMWSSASVGTVGGRELVFFGGGDGVCYAFEALKAPPPGERPGKLKTVWRFHCDPAGRKEVPLDFQDNRREGPSVISGMPVFHEGRVYVTAGGDVWHGKREAWLKCIDAAKTGDTTKTAQVWSCPLKRHSMSTPAIQDGLVYITDCGGFIRCLEADTGRPCWVQETRGDIWASPLVADGKVYVGNLRGRLWILRAGRHKKVLATIRLGSSMPTSPVAANGVLYIATMKTLFAAAKAPE